MDAQKNHTHANTHAHVLIHTRTQTPTYHALAVTHTHTHTHTLVLRLTSTLTLMRFLSHTYTHTNTRTHIYTDTYIDTQTHQNSVKLVSVLRVVWEQERSYRHRESQSKSSHGLYQLSLALTIITGFTHGFCLLFSHFDVQNNFNMYILCLSFTGTCSGSILPKSLPWVHK